MEGGTQGLTWLSQCCTTELHPQNLLLFFIYVFVFGGGVVLEGTLGLYLTCVWSSEDNFRS